MGLAACAAAVLCASLVAFASLSRAAPTCGETWTGPGGTTSSPVSGVWNGSNTANWSPAAIPTGAQDVCLPAGAYTVTLNGSQFANTITVGGGATLSVAISGGTGAQLTLSSTGNSSNAGTIELTDADGSGSASTPSEILLNAGASLTNDGTIVSDGTGGSRIINGGSVASTLTNAADGTVTVNTDLQIDASQAGVFTTSGAITINSGTNLRVDPNGGFVVGNPSSNTAGMDIEGGTITDSGTFSQGAAGLTVNGGTITGAGLIATSGSSAGTSPGSAGASFGGSGSGTYTFVGSGSATTLGGTIGPSQAVVLSASATAGVPVQVNSGLINNGTLELAYSDASGTSTNTAGIQIGTGSTLTNNGTIATSGTHGQRVIDAQSATGTLVNAAGGTIDVGGTLQLDPSGSGTFTTNGTITVEAGQTFQADPNGGSTVFNLNGGTVTDNGVMELGINASGNSSRFETLNINGGAVNGNPIIAANATTNFSGNGSGAFMLEGAQSIFSGGTISGTIDANQTVTVSGTSGPSGSAVVTASGAVVNDGTFTLTDPDTGPSTSVFAELEIPNGSSFTNNGTFISDPGPDGSGYRSIDGMLTNAGTLNVNMLLQLALHATSGIDNSGTVNIASGQAYQQGLMIGGAFNSYSQTAGTTNLEGSADLSVASVSLSGGTLTGSGTICGPGGTQSAPCGTNSGTAEVTNTGGTVRPSPSPSTITVKGDYTQGSGGTLSATVTGVGANDQLAVSGTATLDGTLSVATASGYNPSDLQYVVLTAAGVSGQFATTQLSSGPYTIAYNATSVTLTGANFAPAVSFNPAAITFGSAASTIAAGATVTQTLTVSDIGNAPLNIGTLSLSGPQASSFSLRSDGCSSTVLQAAGTCQVTIVFSPAAGGSYSADLVVPDNASGSPQQVALSGTVGASGARATLSPGSLTFAETRVGDSSPVQTVTVTSTGSDPLKVSTVSVGGAAPADFKVSDACAGQSLAPGGSCTTAVTFAPTGTGSRTATVSYADNAPDSPQSVALSGPGTDVNLVGRVTASGQPASASVYACPSLHPETSTCVSTGTAADGSYQLQLTPGAWLLQVWPSQAGLFGATATVDVGTGLTTQNFALNPPNPLTGGFAVNGQTSGVPTIYYNAPYTLTAPLPIPGTGTANSTQLFIGSAGVDGGTSSPDPSQQFVQAAMILMTVHYDANGDIQAISNPIVGALPCQASAQETAACASLYQLSAGSSAGPAPQRRSRDGGPVATKADFPPPGDDCYYNAIPSETLTNVQMTPNEYGGITITKTYGDGHTEVFLLGAAQIPQLSGASNQWVNVTVIDPTNAVVSYNPLSGWYNAAVGSLNSIANGNQTTGQAAAQYYKSAAWQIAAQGFGGGFHGATSVFWNWYSTEVNSYLTPGGVLNNLVSPSGPTNATPTGFCKAHVANAFIDPSGTVKTSSGIPVAGATVTLMRSPTASGRVTAVPRGSVLMSPGNRRNPDHTNALGQYGWDVLPGFYQITASRHGCTARGHGSARSRLLPVPPAQTGIDLVLRCPKLHRTAAHVRLKVRKAASKTATNVVTATVTGHKPSPQGYVTFKAGRRVLGEVPLLPGGTARWTIPGYVRLRTVTASYGGDAYHAPGSARTRL